MTATTFTAPMAHRPEPPRDGRGQYLIQVDPTRKAVGYQRATNAVKPLDDTYNLQKWQQRMVATGLAMKPHLLSSVGAHLHDKSKLNALCESAMEAAGATERRERGSKRHDV